MWKRQGVLCGSGKASADILVNALQVKYVRDGKVDYVLMGTHTHTKTTATQNGQAATKFPCQPFNGRTHKDNCRLQLQSCVDGVGGEQDNNVAFTRFGSFSLACFPHYYSVDCCSLCSPLHRHRSPSAALNASERLQSSTTRRSFRSIYACTHSSAIVLLHAAIAHFVLYYINNEGY